MRTSSIFLLPLLLVVVVGCVERDHGEQPTQTQTPPAQPQAAPDRPKMINVPIRKPGLPGMETVQPGLNVNPNAPSASGAPAPQNPAPGGSTSSSK